MVEDRGGKFGVAGMNVSGGESVSDEDTCPRTFEKFLHVEGNQRFILNHKHQAPFEPLVHLCVPTLR